MSAGWLVYVLTTGALISVAAAACDGLLRARRLPTRWVWAAALPINLAVAGVTAIPGTRQGATSVVGTDIAATPTGASEATFGSVLMGLRRLFASYLDAGVAFAAGEIPAWLVGAAGGLWSGSAVVALGTLLLVYLRLSRARRRWPRTELHGRAVRVAPQVGPVVVGVVRPEIVIPQWLLARNSDEQRLVIAHEGEHVRAGDHLLLASACVTVALMPWHPAAWWALSRMRLAVELDCDARVLQRGVPARRYGAMLIDLAGQCSGFRVGATALTDTTTHLERRLLAMRPTIKRFTHMRAAALTAIAALALAAACEARVPTSAEIQSMDVAGAERVMARNGLMGAVHGTRTEFYVNDVKVSAAEAHAIPPNDIATVNVEKSTGPGGVSTIRIRTVAVGAGGGKYRTGSAGEVRASFDTTLSVSAKDVVTPIILIDGVRADAQALHRLDPKSIFTVDVIKGAQARLMLADPAAENGIIKVTTNGVRTRQ